MPDSASLRAAELLPLELVPHSDEARALVFEVAAILAPHDAAGRKTKRRAIGEAKRIAAVGAIVGGLLRKWSGEGGARAGLRVGLGALEDSLRVRKAKVRLLTSEEDGRGMFFTTKSSVRRGVYKETAPFVATLEETGGLPAGFWQAPYVVGWFNGLIGGFIKIIGNGKFGPADTEVIRDGVLEDLAGRTTADRVAKDVALLQASQDPDFREGAANAAVLIAVTLGSRDFDSHSDVITARASTEQGSGAPASEAGRHAEMCIKLQELLFYDRVRT